jgi:molybdopterin molybdotransferase
MLSFEDARACVVREITKSRKQPRVESIALDNAAGRLLAVATVADRDYPTLNRSVRDGFAVRADDVPGKLKVVGESRAGGIFAGQVGVGEAVEIMTGAPVPSGANAVVMVEHVERDVEHDGDFVTVPKAAVSGQFISFRGEEAVAGQELLPVGKRIRYGDIALLAATGHAQVDVFAKTRVAILPTGDELVPVAGTPRDHQVRNSNAHSLAAQVVRCGATPYMLPPAKDNGEDTRDAMERALASSDVLLLSGGVSAGKYDVVERVLSEMGAEFFFDRVAIQPGQPLVFGRVDGKFFFGLPGNPGSTMVTFEVFARLAIELIGGQTEPEDPWALGRLTEPFHHKPGLTRFLPGLLTGVGDLKPLPWKGSSDVPALAMANVYLVANAAQEEWQAGDTIPVIFK